MKNLTKTTTKVIHHLYKSREAMEIADMLDLDCNSMSLGCNGWSLEQLERIHLAILKSSYSKNQDIEITIKQAKKDWRDVLVSAGFAEDLEAHKLWAEGIGN
ncbi:hypothetical protein tinsulaeT_38860 [Thalassotalea insulae]|uniref:Uncharacterized protein n=1 Tax=Thalassotalea insulae TaxID=2056778 RepID=A0ABQ6GX81_9GAMM|nr:hypothetical protein [Thalassotalea insulae]GLX80546.1 hypothetical protein tinsulaeT_38860 [Thalassotalea insulae]